MALGRESGILRKGGQFAQMFAPGIADPLAWLGDDVAIYVENDPVLLKELEGVQDVEEYLEHNFHRLPLGIHVPSKDPFQRSLSSLIHLSDRLAWNSSFPSTVGIKAPELDIDVYDQVGLGAQQVEDLLPQIHEDFAATDMPW